MVFDDDLSLREPTDAEIELLAGNPDLIEVMQVVKMFRDQRKKEGR